VWIVDSHARKSNELAGITPLHLRGAGSYGRFWFHGSVFQQKRAVINFVLINKELRLPPRLCCSIAGTKA